MRTSARAEPLVTELIRGGWLRYIRTYNAVSIGETTELGEFLFGSERSGLGRYPEVLADLQGGRCFYCQRPLHSAVDVDHLSFPGRVIRSISHTTSYWPIRSAIVPKPNYLPAEPHLCRWLDRNRSQADELADRFSDLGVVHDLTASVRVAEWAYSQEATTGGRVWVGGRELAVLSAAWPDLFAGSAGRA